MWVNFLMNRKKLKLYPYIKKETNSLKDYRPISLLLICSKIFEHLIYDEMFTFFIEKNLISPNQSGFRPKESCVNQLPTKYINHLKSFKVRGFS